MTDNDEHRHVFDPAAEYTIGGDLANRGVVHRSSDAAWVLLERVLDKAVQVDPTVEPLDPLHNLFAGVHTQMPDDSFAQDVAELGLMLCDLARPSHQQALAVVVDHDGVPRLFKIKDGHPLVAEGDPDGP